MKFRIDNIQLSGDNITITVSDIDDIEGPRNNNNPYREYSYTTDITNKTLAEIKTEVKAYFTAEATKRINIYNWFNTNKDLLIGKIL